MHEKGKYSVNGILSVSCAHPDNSVQQTIPFPTRPEQHFAGVYVCVDFNSTSAMLHPLMETTFGRKLHELRHNKGMTLRALAEAAGVDFTYLSKIENDKIGYLPGADTIRDLAVALDVDAIELLQLANKLPPELASLAGNAKARRFFQRAQEIASPKDWDVLLDLLESRQSARSTGRKKGGSG
jgi:transcriptional regulator with XRE-family HTH domain